MSVIHCIGDSHCSLFSGENSVVDLYNTDRTKTSFRPDGVRMANDCLKNFITYRLGPYTAYNLSDFYNIDKTDAIKECKKIVKTNVVSDSDKILLVFGSIDCTSHVMKQVNLQKKPEEYIIKELVIRYLDAIKKKFSDMNMPIIIWGPIASWSEKKPYPGISYGTELERNNCARLYNEKLESVCSDYGYDTLNIFNEMLNEDGTTNHTLMDEDFGHLHLNQNLTPIILDKFRSKGYI
jgi:hypothetical protein